MCVFNLPNFYDFRIVLCPEKKPRAKCGRKRRNHKKSPINFHNISYVMCWVAVGQETQGWRENVAAFRCSSFSVLLFVSMTKNQLSLPSSRRKMFTNRSFREFSVHAFLHRWMKKKNFSHPRTEAEKKTPVVDAHKTEADTFLVKSRALQHTSD